MKDNFKSSYTPQRETSIRKLVQRFCFAKLMIFTLLHKYYGVLRVSMKCDKFCSTNLYSNISFSFLFGLPYDY